VAKSKSGPFKGEQPVVGDFFAPFFTVRFLTTEEQTGDVSADGSGDDEEVDVFVESATRLVFQGDKTTRVFFEDGQMAELRNFATQLEVEVQGGGMASATLTLQPTFEDAIRIVDDRLIQHNSIMVCEWGWVGAGSQERISSGVHFFMITQPALEASGTDYNITITGVDLLGYGTMKRSSHVLWDREQYKTDLDIVREIAKRSGLSLDLTLVPAGESTVDADGNVTTEGGSKLRAKKPLNDSEPDVVEQHEKDWTFLKQLLAENDCDFFTIGDKVFIVDQNIAKVQDAAYRFTYFMQPEGERDIPMETFSTNALRTIFFPAAGKSAKTMISDPDTGETTAVRHDPARMSDEKHTGPKTAAGRAEADGRAIRINDEVTVIPNPSYTDDEDGVVYPVSAQKNNSEEYGKQPARRGSTMANTQASLTSPGVPSLVPQMIVRVAGVGKTFSGAYRVMKVVHTLSTAGYDMGVELLREASSGDPVSGKGERPITGGEDPKLKTEAGEEIEPELEE
jgi:phage protein D